jgi:hypothetical protein
MRRVKIYGYFLQVTYNIQSPNTATLIEAHVLSQESERSCICVLGVSLPSLYQARKVNGHVFVC